MSVKFASAEKFILLILLWIYAPLGIACLGLRLFWEMLSCGGGC